MRTRDLALDEREQRCGGSRRAEIGLSSEGSAAQPRRDGVGMSLKGTTQLTFIIVAPPDQVAEGYRIFRSHATWKERTHPRTGDTALCRYTVSKAPQLSNPMAPGSGATGNPCFILDEFYESDAGLSNHFAEAQASWQDFAVFRQWLGKRTLTAVPAAAVINSLW
jgi:hypothetical protein